MGIRRTKMDKSNDKMRQDSAKMRKMKDVSSVFGPPWEQDPVRAANSLAGRGHGEGLAHPKGGTPPLPLLENLLADW